ncbi:MAG: sialate O-acetylesterase [Chitinophagaceae bacterium]|jgi:lysophospholipase L1-like esterase|nr:sialate O-acetylesterase [Chitinophagaceae bacterium]
MRIIITSLLCFAATSIVSAQRPAYDSTYRPGNFALKVAQFRSYANAPTDIIFLGNSITAGTEWAELLGMPNVRNRGISSDISFGVLERLDEVTEGKPAKVFILIGINDISRNIPDSLILQNYRRIIARIKLESPTTQIYFHTLLPVNNTFTQFKNHYNKDEHIQYVNTELKKIAAEEKIGLIDLHPNFLDADMRLDSRYTVDGLHLNAAGYQVWKKILFSSGYLK